MVSKPTRRNRECLIAYVLDVEDVMMGGWL